MSTDPTRSKTLRTKFEADCYKRFRIIKGDIRTVVEERRVLAPAQSQAASATLAPRRDEFRFLSTPEKREQFLEWLRQRTDEEVLVTHDRDTIRRGQHWTATYVRTMYAKGVEHADSELRKQGYDVPREDIQNVFNKPVHSQKLELLYTRTFDALEGVTREMDKQISRTLTDGLSQGWAPRKTASKLNDRVDKIGITRARTIARTETINAHAEGTLDRLESRGIETVTADVEFSTAGDSRVCPLCKSLDGTVYSIEDARGRIPRHPQCRCAWLPVVDMSDD